MLTQQEKDFLQYWETHREKEARFAHQLLSGLPLGLCFGLPILLCFIFRAWYKWLPFVSDEDLVVVAFAVLVIVFFFAVFRQKYMWEQKDQQYQELKARKKSEPDTLP